MATKTPFCAAADWGTSSFRLWLLAEDGAILGERRSREGMLALGTSGFAPALDAHLAALGTDARLPVVVCGMAGARQGWIEAPYVDAPADLAGIAAGAIRVPNLSRDVRILPGIAQRPAAGRAADVMRGEETQVMGLGASGDALLCLPGTHSKWVDLQGGRIAGFSTFMTGEIFALLSEHSILRHAVGAASGDAPESSAFEAGVRASLDEPAAILNRLFALRAAGLLEASTPEASRARLSGLLIGAEIAGARALHPHGGSVTLVASGALVAPYRAALELAGFSVGNADADAAVRAGLLAAARHCFRPRKGAGP